MIKDCITYVEQMEGDSAKSGERDVVNLINEFMQLLAVEDIKDLKKRFLSWVKEKGLSKKIANEVGSAVEDLLSADDLDDLGENGLT